MSGSVLYVQKIGLLRRILLSTGRQFLLGSWGKSVPLAGHLFLHPLRAGSDPECFMAFFDSFLSRLNSCWTSWETFSTNWEQRRQEGKIIRFDQYWVENKMVNEIYTLLSKFEAPLKILNISSLPWFFIIGIFHLCWTNISTALPGSCIQPIKCKYSLIDWMAFHALTLETISHKIVGEAFW